MISERFVAGFVAAVIIAPHCAMCVLGPAVIASIFTGVAAWLGGFDAIVTAGLTLIAAIAVYGVIRKRGARRMRADSKAEMRQ